MINEIEYALFLDRYRETRDLLREVHGEYLSLIDQYESAESAHIDESPDREPLELHAACERMRHRFDEGMRRYGEVGL